MLGVVSDTHGTVRPEMIQALDGVRMIIHAGDVGGTAVLRELNRVAPVRAVCGNMDGSPLRGQLPGTEVVEVDGLSLYVLHDLARLDLDPAAGGFAAVISGHTHRPAVSWQDGVLYLNPGAAGPRRSAPPTVARLHIEDGKLRPELVPL